MSARIWLRRAYEAPGRSDGTRVLVDRIWPRGVSRDDAHIDHWYRQLAPSDELRKWFGHETARWEQFRRRYREELRCAGEQLAELVELARAGRVTLVFAARDTEHNNAVVLRELLEERLGA